MKIITRKALSVLLATMIVFSICAVGITQASAEELTFNDFNIIEGTGAKANYIVDDPVVEGEKAIKLYTTTSRPNLKVADPNDNTTALVLTRGTTYTLVFDYYFDSNTSNPQFALYYGKDPSAEGQRTPVNESFEVTENGFSADFIGDGKWHTATYTFTAKIPTGGGATLDNLFLTYYSSAGSGTRRLSGYIKNLRVVVETAVGWKETTHLLGYFDGQGNADANIFNGIGKTATGMTDSYINSDGDAVFVPTQDIITKVTNKQTTLTACDYITVLDSSNAPVIGKNDGLWNIYFNVKYKVTGLGEGGQAAIGVGRASTTNTENTLCFNSMTVTQTNDDWKYYTAPIYTNSKSGALRLYLGGKDATIVIDYVEVVYCGPADSNFTIAKFNDNGKVNIELVYVGASVAKNGESTENLALGERLLGWYSDSVFTTVADKYAALDLSGANGNTNVYYSKYPTIIIDNFTMLEQYATEAAFSKSGASYNGDALQFNNGASGAGAMIPAYDDDVLTYFSFTEGHNYHVKVYYSSVSTNTGADARINMLRRTGYETGNTVNTNQLFAQNASPTAYDGVLSQTFTYEEYQSVKTMAIRPHNNTALKATVTIDKITVSDISLLKAQADKEMVSEGSIRYESTNGDKYVSAGVRFKARLSAATRDVASEIGFVAVPTEYLTNTTFEKLIAQNSSLVLTGKTKAEGMNEILYANGTDAYGQSYYDYQLIITGLTRKNSALSLLDTSISVAVYTVIDGIKTYSTPIAYSYNTVNDAYELYNAHKQTEGSEMRIMSFNIACRLGVKSKRVPTILTSIDTYNPDIIGLQECNHMAHDLVVSELLDEYSYAGKLVEDDNSLTHTPILYRKDKFTVIESGASYLRTGGGGTRTLTWAVFEDNITHKHFIMTNIHVQPGTDNVAVREDNVLEISEKIAELKVKYGDIASFSSGDYNMNSNESGYQNMISYGFRDPAICAETINKTGIKTFHSSQGTNPTAGLPIDHIFVSGNASLLFYDIATDKTTIDASDHCSIYIDVALEN